MATFKVIEGTVWEIEAETQEQAKAIYEAHFAGEGDDLPMREVEGSSYWYGTEHKEGGAEAVSWLEEVYGEGIHGTDAYAEFIGQSEDCECEWCSADEEEEGE